MMKANGIVWDSILISLLNWGGLFLAAFQRKVLLHRWIAVWLFGLMLARIAFAENDQSDPTAQSSFDAWRQMSDDDAWNLLPAIATGSKGVMPNWAKAVSVQLPRTAAAMLELDSTFRTKAPLDPALRAKLRWVVANANRCEYAQACAAADLKRIMGGNFHADVLTADESSWLEGEMDAFQFVKQLTIAAPQIPDALFQRLRAKYGDNQVAAMVLLTAYGNFQDRILLGLNIPIEAGGPLAPSDIKFVDGALQVGPILPLENGVEVYEKSGKAVVPREESWISLSYDQLQTRLESQRDRQPRLPIPAWDEVKVKLPEAMRARPTAIRWSLMNYGYAPELAIAWTTTTRTHWSECPSDRIFEESLFWIQTRAIECNYCMGHCEMLLEVAGLDKNAVAKRTRLLAETDWADFPAAEQRAYAYARKLSRTPYALTPDDYRELEKDFGPKRAMSIFWWLCRGLYMTRISDGFQLPLERENVFQGHGGPPSDNATKKN